MIELQSIINTAMPIVFMCFYMPFICLIAAVLICILLATVNMLYKSNPWVLFHFFNYHYYLSLQFACFSFSLWMIPLFACENSIDN